MRRVLMTTDTVGGVWNYSIDLCRYLDNQGVEVFLATMGSPMSESQRQDANEILGLRIFESHYKLEWMDDPWEDVWQAGRWLASLDACIRPDIVHLNSYSFGAQCWSAPRVMVCHSCVYSWWESVKSGLPPREWSAYREKVIKGLGKADMIVAPTQAMLSAADRLYGPFSNARVIPNGRPPENYDPNREKEPFVLSVGRFWDEGKNIAALVEAGKAVAWPVYVAGETGDPTQGSRITALGQLSSKEVSDWMARASIYALPAKYEPFGLSILEAALSGCALVLGDIPSLRENWTGCSLFVDPYSPDELARAIQTLIKDPRLRVALGTEARKRGLGFGADAFGRGYLDAYRELISRDAAASPSRRMAYV